MLHQGAAKRENRDKRRKKRARDTVQSEWEKKGRRGCHWGHTAWVTKPYWIYLSCSAPQMNLIYCGWQQREVHIKQEPGTDKCLFLYNEWEAGPLVGNQNQTVMRWLIPWVNRAKESIFINTHQSLSSWRSQLTGSQRAKQTLLLEHVWVER